MRRTQPPCGTVLPWPVEELQLLGKVREEEAVKKNGKGRERQTQRTPIL